LSIQAFGDSSGSIGASIGNDKNVVAIVCVIQIAQAFQRTGDPDFLIMRGNQDEESGLRAAGSSWEWAIEKRTHGEKPLI